MTVPIRRKGISSFLSDCVEARECLRCSQKICRAALFTSDKDGKFGDGWAALAQVLNNNTVVGGILCVDCVDSFREWMKGSSNERS